MKKIFSFWLCENDKKLITKLAKQNNMTAGKLMRNIVTNYLTIEVNKK